MTSNTTVLDDLRSLLQRQAGDAADGQEDPLLPDFVDAYFDGALYEQLRTRSPEELLAAARAHLALAEHRAPDAIGVSVIEFEAAHHGCDTAVMTLAPDMPFLVDTVSMAVRDTGADIDWIVHPVVRLARDGDGRLTRVEGVANLADYGDEESLIYIEFAAPAGLDRAALTERIKHTLTDLQTVIADWQPMRRQLHRVVAELDAVANGAGAVECIEVKAFLRWLDNDHFTLLGYRQRAVEGGDTRDEAMADVPESSLGLLREDRPGIDPDGYVAPAAEMEKYAQSSRILVVAKANARAWIHHAEPMDVIAIKRLDDKGNVIGAHRFLGLFSAEAYAASPRDIPVLNHKVRQVLTRAALRPRSHAAKSLGYILETFPRDELFQSSEEELYTTVMGVLGLRESEPLRLFLRRDRYGRFYSCLVYIPRERYTLALRQLVEGELERLLGGQSQDADAQFLRGALVRVHYQIGTDPGARAVDADELEQALLKATRYWPDEFLAVAGRNDKQVAGYAHAFTAGYMERVEAARAVDDARVLARLAPGDAPVLTLNVAAGDDPTLRLKLFGMGDETPLSAVLPVLENFGLAVRTQRPFAVQAPGSARQWIHEFEAGHEQAAALTDAARAAHVADAFAQVTVGAAESDGLNRLIIAAGLTPREVVLVRTMTRYLLQSQLPFGRVYLETMLADNADVVARIIALFGVRFDPDRPDATSGSRQTAALIEEIEQQLDEVASLDTDRALRAMLGVVLAGLRTNYYQPDENGGPKPYVSLKLDPAQVPELPLPLPVYEAFVYSPEVEGVHLRGGLVARGGLRWSDRREDFRTEVLGLMKAQMVKNAVIVPVGAKGGFVVKNAVAGEDREARQARGIDCYKTFLRGLLDVTDNRQADAIVPPAHVVRHDGDDPYLVVAADKGTATFSDIANRLAREYGFWLDDAFASGGSAGYDHKEMGITARGGWEGVKRHFREMGRDIQRQSFTVVGIGDMAGDVFGNGMLLSEQIRLVAAFNHMHIFIDPDPDPAVSFAERKRLFAMGRSSWSDYDLATLSEGGGIFPRSAKLIQLSEAARNALGIVGHRLTPTALIHELLAAPVDLLWNGGIGTYVKARSESHAQVGDRANDGLRVDGRDLRCKVVGEGGNLGLTQAGRIEYALAGGRLNTDAIDNSGGVDSSDLEVNIKIALGAVEAAGQLSRDDRNTLLTQMTDSVIELVLRSNYLQTQQISRLEVDSLARFDEQINFMRTLEREGLLDRRIEGLPDDEVVAERKRNQNGLTRPELAVLLSYSKIVLADAVLASDLPDDPWLEGVLFDGFPDAMRSAYAEAIRGHRLKRELITTLITNQAVDRLGIAMAHRLAADFDVSLAQAVRAYLLADAWLDTESLFCAIEELDNIVAAEAQYQLQKIVTGLLKHAMGWLLSSSVGDASMTDLVARYQAPAQQLLGTLPEYLTGAYHQRWQDTKRTWQQTGLNEDMAERVASAAAGGGLLDIAALADQRGVPAPEVARVYFELGDYLGFAWLHHAIEVLQVDGRWPALARASLRGDCYDTHQRLVAMALEMPGDAPFAVWCEEYADDIDFVHTRVSELQAIAHPSFAHLTVAVRDLAQLSQARER